MAAEHELPTVEEMFIGAQAELSKAYQALGDAADWLRSDWRPMTASLTSTQSAARTIGFQQIDKAKRAINRIHDAIDGTRPSRSQSDEDGDQ